MTARRSSSGSAPAASASRRPRGLPGEAIRGVDDAVADDDAETRPAVSLEAHESHGLS